MMLFRSIKKSLDLLKKIDGYSNDKLVAGESLPYGEVGMFASALLNFCIWGTSFSEFFAYRFYRKSFSQKKEYMTRRHMFKFFDKYNPKEYRNRIGDKRESEKYYGHLMKREQFNYTEGFEKFELFCSKYNELFIKRAVGWGGTDAFVADVSNNDNINATWSMIDESYVVEPKLVNCDSLKNINPKSLNTIKVTTLIKGDGEPEIQTALFRCGNNTCVDNVHSGGMCALVNIDTGIIETEAIDNHFMKYTYHPISGEKIQGLEIPFWNEVKQLSLEAAIITPQIRYASWDIAVLKDGPVMIEGNWDAEFYAEQMLLDRGNKNIFIKNLES